MKHSTNTAVFLVPRIDGKTGGLERQALQLASAVAALDCRVFFVTCAHWNVMRAERLPIKGAIGGVDVYRVPIFSGWRRLNALLYLCGGIAFLVMVRSRYAIIHAHELHSSGLVACMGKVLLRSKKVIVKSAAAGAWMGDLANLGRLPAAHRVRALVRKHADVMVGVSPEVVRELTEAGFRRVELVPNGVDTRRFSPLPPDERAALKASLLGDGSDRPVILFVGRLGPEKNLPVLLDAMARLNVNARLLIVGDGALASEIRNRAHEIGIDRNVIFWGAAEQVERFYQIADAFVLPSLTEGSPNALLEAMSAGVPSIGSDVPGISAIITDGVNGALFPASDAGRLAEILTHVLTDREWAGRLSNTGRQHVLDRFSLDRTAAQYVALYRELSA